VDAETGQVLMHKETKKPPSVTDIAQAAKDLQQGAGRREELFKKNLEAEKNKGDRLKKQFEEALKKAKENPDAPLPPREIDL
jgi:ElaB/YqjD/DUF883 family membrane-anchored ribosome-binding protein